MRGKEAGTQGKQAPRKPFTDVYLRSLPAVPPGHSVRYADPQTPHLSISCKGTSKSWLIRYTDARTRKKAAVGIGSYPLVSLASARAATEAVMECVRRGIDPKPAVDAFAAAIKEGENSAAVARRIAERVRGGEDIGAAAKQATFREVAETWLQDMKADVADRTRRGIEQRLRAHLFPALGDRPIAKIELKEAAAVLVAIEKPRGPRGARAPRGGPVVARRVLGIFSEVIDFAANRGLATKVAVPPPRLFVPRKDVQGRLEVPHSALPAFRALARTTLAEAPFSFPADVLEAQLAHAKEGAVVAAYDRGERFVERRKVAEAWANHLESLRPGWLPVTT